MNKFKVADARFCKSKEAILGQARGYLAVSSGTITDEVIQEYIFIQEGEPLHDNDQF